MGGGVCACVCVKVREGANGNIFTPTHRSTL